MSGPVISANLVDAIALPRLVWLRPNLIGLVFTLMKLLPARFIIRKALEEGELRPGGLIVEATSGTFGLSLAMVSALQGHPLTLVGDPAIDPPLLRRLEDLGATVHIVREAGASGGFRQVRQEVLEKVLASTPGSFCPRQYSNPHNPGSYAPCAEQLAHAVGGIDCLVGSVGSGGSVCGISSYLRLILPELNVIGVDTHGSVIFGETDAGNDGWLLREVGNSLIPANVDHTAFDLVHWVGAAEAFQATRRLHREHALHMGPTSGAAFLVADWWARNHPDSLTAVIFPDEGYRYQDTVYNDAWLEAKGVRRDVPPREPVEWNRPYNGRDPWSFFRWGRRAYSDVMWIGPSADQGNSVATEEAGPDAAHPPPKLVPDGPGGAGATTFTRTERVEVARGRTDDAPTPLLRVSAEVPVWVDADTAAEVLGDAVRGLSALDIALGGNGLEVDGIDIGVAVSAYA
ncbi:pyridoxal-phosphate dependent enzyme [Longimicrobium sp.]|jgi:cysteine synthase A|uniref:pyridoxal-phosphate dependent enzyme n=1 Tax=Longimicrobium sp. TaxID=2029185 RepID=UPI002ED8E7C5